MSKTKNDLHPAQVGTANFMLTEYGARAESSGYKSDSREAQGPEHAGIRKSKAATERACHVAFTDYVLAASSAIRDKAVIGKLAVKYLEADAEDAAVSWELAADIKSKADAVVTSATARAESRRADNIALAIALHDGLVAECADRDIIAATNDPNKARGKSAVSPEANTPLVRAAAKLAKELEGPRVYRYVREPEYRKLQQGKTGFDTEGNVVAELTSDVRVKYDAPQRARP